MMEKTSIYSLVSIIIPVFNVETFISEMLDDLISQTYKEWEVILVDDGSTDNSVDICERYSFRDKRFRLYKRPKELSKGGNSCRNYGLDLAKGKYVIWFDADDRIATYCLEQRVSFMENNEIVDIGVFPAVDFKESKRNEATFALGFDVPSDPVKYFIQGCLWFAVWTNIYRKEALLKKNIRWSEGLASRQDCDFNLTCMRAGLDYSVGKGKADYFYRVALNPNSISKGINKGKSRATLDFFNLQYAKFCDIKGVPLKSLVHYVFECVMMQDNKEIINDFFNTDYFKKNVIDRCKFWSLMLVAREQIPGRVKSIFKLMLFPNSYLRYRKIKNRTHKVRTGWLRYDTAKSI